MKGLEDPQFRTYYNEMLQLDWTGLDVWVVGGIVSGWDTSDIDTIILGDRPEAEINALMLQLKQLDGPWSPFYAKNDRAVTWNRYSKTRTLIKVYLANPSSDTLREQTYKFPTQKNHLRMKKGIYVGEPVQLIQNGAQIYL